MKKNNIFFKKLWLIILILSLVILRPSFTLAQVGGPDGEPSGQVGGPSESSIPGPLDALKAIQGDVGNNLMPSGDIVLIIIRILNYILTFLGVIFILMIIYGGYTWMTAVGNEEKVKKGKTILQTAIIGLTIVVLARVLYIFILQRISEV